MIRISFVYAVVAAFLFGISSPLAKLLLKDVHPVSLSGLLYLGAFLGLFLYSTGRMLFMPRYENKALKLERKDLPWLAYAVITGGVLAPISLMKGLSLVSGFTASLLLNLEGAATTIIAVAFFKEKAGKNLWLALIFMTLSGVFLTWDPTAGKFTLAGPLLIIFAMVCWGLDNNFTRVISHKDPIQIAMIKGLVSGTTSILIALFLGVHISFNLTLILAMLLGSFSYGVSLVLYIKALEGLGSSRTGVIFGLAPFIGAFASIVILRERLRLLMLPATLFMIIGLFLLITEERLHSER